jgi:hypothetical protein
MLCNIFLPSTPKSPKWPLLFSSSSSSSSQYSTCISHVWFLASAASWTLRIGPILCPEMSARNYHHSLSDNPEERSSPVFLKSAVCVTSSIHLILPYHIALIKICMQKMEITVVIERLSISSLFPHTLFRTFFPIIAHCSPLSWPPPHPIQ